MDDLKTPLTRVEVVTRRALLTDAQTTINLTKCFIGAASFALPWAVMQGGTVGSVVGILVLALLSRFSLSNLATCGRLVEGKEEVGASYPEIGFASFGRPGKAVAWFGVLAMTLGVCGSYIVFVTTTMNELVRLGNAAWCAIVVVPLTVLSWLRNYKLLWPTALLGIVALLFAVGATVYDCADKHSTDNITSYPKVRITSYPLFLGNAAYLYLICTAILPLEQSMKNPRNFTSCLTRSMVFVTVLNLAFALYAYMSYGDCHGDSDRKDCTQGNTISNLSGSAVTTFVKVSLAVDLVFTCLMFLLPVSDALERELFDASQFGSCQVEMKRNLVRAVQVAAISLIALGIPFFEDLTGLSGGFGNNILGFILPPVFYVQLQRKRHYWDAVSSAALSRWEPTAWARLGELVANLLTLCFGVVFLVLSTYSFVDDISKRS